MNSAVVDHKLTTFAHVCPCCLEAVRCSTPGCHVPVLRDCGNCDDLDAEQWAERCRLSRTQVN